MQQFIEQQIEAIRIVIFIKWAASWQNQQNDCALVKTQISLGICPVWSESSLSVWRKLGSLVTRWAQSEDSDQTGRMPWLIWVFTGCTVILLVLSRGDSNNHANHDFRILMQFGYISFCCRMDMFHSDTSFHCEKTRRPILAKFPVFRQNAASGQGLHCLLSGFSIKNKIKIKKYTRHP